MSETDASEGPVPRTLRTTRMLLRPWRPSDAEALAPVLVANLSHLSPWIPRRVWEPADVPVLAERLAGFAAEFEGMREWRYAMFAGDDGRVLGEVALFPRAESGRVPFEQADRGEIGYWLRADATGTGLATEAAEAMLRLATTLPTFGHVEIRCDARNASSSAIPRRLGFTLASTEDDTSAGLVEQAVLQVWSLALREGAPPPA